MFKFLVLVGLVACAAAAPAPEEADIVSMVKECTANCAATYGPSGDDYKYCTMGCNLGAQRFPDNKNIVPIGAGQARGFDSCANGACGWTYAFPPSIAPCMAICMAAGGRRRSIDFPMDDFKNVAVADSEVGSLRQARGGKECAEACVRKYGYDVESFGCLYDCGARYRSSSLQSNAEKALRTLDCGQHCKPALDVDRVSYVTCYLKCQNMMQRTTLQPFGIPADSSAYHAVASLRQARGAKECGDECYNKYGFGVMSFGCLYDCSTRFRSSSLQSNAEKALRTPDCSQQCKTALDVDRVSYGICFNKCQIMQRTPFGIPADSSAYHADTLIANILSEVMKKQQELEQMIQSCKCAKPLTPFGQDNGALGPNF